MYIAGSFFFKDSKNQRYLQLVYGSSALIVCVWESIFFYQKNNKKRTSGLIDWLVFNSIFSNISGMWWREQILLLN